MSDQEYLPSKTGPKSKFEDWMCDKIKEIAEAGGHTVAMCLAIGISQDTFHRWKKDIPEFKEAYEESKLLSQAFYENAVLLGALGKIPGYNHKAMEMIMNNKFKEYQRTAEKVNTTEITINQLNLSPHELTNKIAQKMEKLKALGFEFKEEDGSDEE